MSSLKLSPRSAVLHPGAHGPRHAACSLLRSASALLAKLARRLAVRRVPPGPEPVIEFHAEAGAPEGALYVDGRLVGYVDGVRRL